jgi:uncharacterized membrane protein YfhO
MSEEQKVITGGSKRKKVGGLLLLIGIISFPISWLMYYSAWNNMQNETELSVILLGFFGQGGIWVTIPMIVVGLDCITTNRKYVVALGCVIIGTICAIASHCLNIHYFAYFGIILSLISILFAAESRSTLKSEPSSLDRAMTVSSLILGIIVCVCSFLTASFGPWS